MVDYNLKYTPPDKDPLHNDLDGESCCDDWDCRSIFGIMLYLVGRSRTCIAYAVHQCTWFSHKPRKSHEVKVTCISRYLKRTKTKGIIMVPDRNNVRIDLYTNVYFSGLYTSEDKMDPISVKIRTGVLFTFGNVFIF